MDRNPRNHTTTRLPDFLPPRTAAKADESWEQYGEKHYERYLSAIGFAARLEREIDSFLAERGDKQYEPLQTLFGWSKEQWAMVNQEYIINHPRNTPPVLDGARIVYDWWVNDRLIPNDPQSIFLKYKPIRLEGSSEWADSLFSGLEFTTQAERIDIEKRHYAEQYENASEDSSKAKRAAVAEETSKYKHVFGPFYRKVKA